MTFTVAGRFFDDRIVICDARFLRCSRNAIDIRDEGDHRLTTAPCRDPGRRHLSHTALNFESVLLEDAGQIPGGLILVKSEFAIAENLIDHLLSENLQLVDLPDRITLQVFQDRTLLRASRRGSDRCYHQSNDEQGHPFHAIISIFSTYEMKRDYEIIENNEINEFFLIFVYFVIFVYFEIPLHLIRTNLLCFDVLARMVPVDRFFLAGREID